MNKRLYITGATVVGDGVVLLQFSDATERIVDIGAFIRLHPHPQYNKYLDEEEFRKFSLDDGNIVWGEDWDLVFPIEQLHAGHIA